VIPEIPTWLSLTVILLTLLVTTVASLAKDRRVRAERAAIAPANAAAATESGGSAPVTDAEAALSPR
jgi:tellurite resistance protein TerC